MHVIPSVPHAWSERPSSHEPPGPPRQQPLGHDCSLHCGWFTQALFWHDQPIAAQSAQAWPPFPQAVCEVPAMHRPFEQHPFAHVAALHVGADTHVPPEHVCP
jgi:hypothetical protein